MYIVLRTVYYWSSKINIKYVKMLHRLLKHMSGAKSTCHLGMERRTKQLPKAHASIWKELGKPSEHVV